MGLDPFSNTEMINSPILEDELIEETINKTLKYKFKEGYQAFWLQKQIPILHLGKRRGRTKKRWLNMIENKAVDVCIKDVEN
jgi:hypothetical protein